MSWIKTASIKSIFLKILISSPLKNLIIARIFTFNLNEFSVIEFHIK